MFDLGWSEMAIILLVALIVIGPKDLPRVARTMGQWVRKGRALAREFQNSLEDMAREAELDEVKRDIEKAGRTDLKKSVEKTIDPEGDLGRAFDPKDTGKKRAAPTATQAREQSAETATDRTDGAAPAERATDRTDGGKTTAPRSRGDVEAPEREKVTADT